MSDLKTKLEEGNLPKEVQETILEAWDIQLAEAREELAADLREELANKYEHDREQTVQAMNEMLNDVIASETKTLAEEKQALAKDRVQSKEHLAKFLEFAVKKLGKEMVELNEDRKGLENSLKMFQEFFLKQSNKELVEFRKETKKLTEARVKVLSEGRTKINEAKAAFNKRAAKNAAKWIAEATAKEFGEFRAEINEARQSRFGQKLFEAMAEEFRAFHYNEDAQIKELTQAIREREGKLEEMTAQIAEKDDLLEASEKKNRTATDRLVRTKKIQESIGHLPASKRKLMVELIEDVPTKELSESIKKYLPMVLKDDDSPVREKKPLTEAQKKASKKVVTGDRPSKIITEADQLASDEEEEIDRIVNLAEY